MIYILKGFLYMLCRTQNVEGCGKHSEVHKYLMRPLDFSAFEKFGSSQGHPEVQQFAKRKDSQN